MDEWMAGEWMVHCMRDHPLHGVPMLGGLWAARLTAPGARGLWAGAWRAMAADPLLWAARDRKGPDQTLLGRHVWPWASRWGQVVAGWWPGGGQVVAGWWPGGGRVVARWWPGGGRMVAGWWPGGDGCAGGLGGEERGGPGPGHRRHHLPAHRQETRALGNSARHQAPGTRRHISYTPTHLPSRYPTPRQIVLTAVWHRLFLLFQPTSIEIS